MDGVPPKGESKTLTCLSPKNLDSRGLRGHKLFKRTRKFSEQAHGQ